MGAITRKEKIMSGENLKPITRKELFFAKAAGQDVQTPTPITREEYFLSKITDGGSGGGSGGNFKKKFMSLTHVKRTGSCNYDFVATLCSAMTNGTENAAYDEEILPTKTSDAIKVSTNNTLYFYFIEDENDLFIYGDLMGLGSNDWLSVSMLLEAEFGGVLTDIDINQMIPNVPYVFFYYVEAD